MKKFISFILAAALSSVMWVSAEAETTPPDGLLTDNAELLTSSEEEKVLDSLEKVSNRYSCDVLVYTCDSLDGSSAANFTADRLDEYLDANGKENAVMLLVCMGTRDMYISTSGTAITYFSDDNIDDMLDDIAGDLSSGNYKDAFLEYSDLCEYNFRDTSDIGNDGDASSSLAYQRQPLTVFRCVTVILSSAVFGLIVAAVVMFFMTRAHKSVALERTANSYIKQGSFDLTTQRDLFLYSNVSKVRRSSGSSGGSGRSGGSRSTTHRSSSGRSHGGGGRKF